jgi:hypothetical protein
MKAVVLVRRAAGFVLRSLLVPVLMAATFLGLTAGGRGTASVSPQPSAIAAELGSHHDLPKGTSMALGDPDKPTTVTYDDKGRLLLTPPKGETFGLIVWRGLQELQRYAGDAGIDMAQASWATSPTTTVTKSQ